MTESILVVDVGSGTQDILVYQPGKNIENCPKFVVPSRTQIVAAQIREATAQGKNVFFHGYLMGGGACGYALRQHLQAGYKAYATPETALTFHDNLDKVKELGVSITAEVPKDAAPIWMGDLDIPSLQQALNAFGVEMPQKFAIAVQDHGYSATESNRVLRFRLWEEFVLNGGELRRLIFDQDIPEVYTRMHAVRQIAPASILADTGTAAILGIIADPYVQNYLETGIIALNIGNSHTLGAAVKGRRVYGIFEQHTSALNPDSLLSLVKRFQAARLTNDEVFEQGGHGACLHPDMRPGWDFIVVTGPRRAMAKAMGWYEAAPFGDMMLTGCFGLLKGLGII